MRASLAHGIALLAAALCVAACAPLTYSETGAIDFEKYRVVRVSVSSDDLVERGSYLAAQLDLTSGFERATIDPSEPVDATLSVNLKLTLTESDDGEGNIVESYSADARYTLAAGQSGLDSGKVSASSKDPNNAAEDALDQIAGKYIAPYRL